MTEKNCFSISQKQHMLTQSQSRTVPEKWIILLLLFPMKKVIVVAVLFTITVCCAFLPAAQHPGSFSFKGDPKTKEQLGEMLFFEKKLSLDGSISCSSCHIPEFGFADTLAFSKGVNGRLGKRNAPSCANLADRPYLFYDGRAATLEDQVKFPVEDKNEMCLPMAEAVKRISSDRKYVAWFGKIYNTLPTEANIKNSIASFERTLETSNTPFDRYMMNDDSSGFSESAARGRLLFMGKKAKCFECHFTPDFTGDEFRNIGLFNGTTLNDSGRYVITKDIIDMGKFRVPGLRNVGATAPYMHNGMFKTLREVIEYYNDPYKIVPNPINIDTNLLHPLQLTIQEQTDLENFLMTLTDDRFAKGR